MKATEKRTRKSTANAVAPEQQPIQEPITALPVVPVDAGQDIQSIIGSAIKQYGVTDHYIHDLRIQYTGLSIGGTQDKEGYELVRKGIATIRELRTAVEKKRNDLNRNAIDYKKAVDEEAKRITSLLVEIENPLKEQKEQVDAEKARIKAEEEARKHQEFVARTTALIERKFSFNGSMYINEDIIVTTNQIREFSEQQWAEVVARAEAKFQEQKAAEAAIEEARKRQMEEQQRQIAEQQAELQRQRAEMLQLQYENRINWLMRNGYVLYTNGFWGKSGFVIADAFVREAIKDKWQAEIMSLEAKVKAAQNPVPTAQSEPAIAPTPTAPTASIPTLKQYPTQKEVIEPTPFNSGFYQCRSIILSMFNDGVKRTREQWIAEISKIEPF